MDQRSKTVLQQHTLLQEEIVLKASECCITVTNTANTNAKSLLYSSTHPCEVMIT